MSYVSALKSKLGLTLNKEASTSDGTLSQGDNKTGSQTFFYNALLV